MAEPTKRTWRTRRGELRTGWVVRYADGKGKWRLKSFARKSDAASWLTTARHEVQQRKHVPASTSPTVADACAAWLRRGEADGLERSTLEQRRQHVDHILRLVDPKARLSRVDVDRLRDALLRTHSHAMARKLMVSYRSILKLARMAHLAADVAPIRTGGRHKKRLEVGRDVPTVDEVRTTLEAATGLLRPLLVLLATCGLRMSEARALRWADIDFGACLLHVRRRADRWGTIGVPKSESSYRQIPLGAHTIVALKEWRLQRPGDGYVLATRVGTVHLAPNIWRNLGALERRLGMVDAAGQPKYGAHSLRHFCASVWLRELGVKRTADLLGHSNAVLVLTTYGHWLPNQDDDERLARAEAALLG